MAVGSGLKDCKITKEPLTIFAVRLGKDPASLSAAIKRLELRRKNDAACEEKVAKLRDCLQVKVFQTPYYMTPYYT